jgi:hypothetical protein
MRDRTAKTPQLQVSEILQNRNRFHCASDAAADQDLPVARIRAPRGLSPLSPTPWQR